ncbi:LOW QUALITY PROTEIN: endoribonuclease Dicer [Panulirus ornatus]|uniref:LOW QUALITY PROTEIN: endoribonuclease Dicer n=1 Tax=Panulirus ornatus TaxID=150431 RepID=UPI003A89A224
MVDVQEASAHIINAVDEAENQEDHADFKPRAYQLELFECAKKQNSILVLGTGSGKTFISILLIKEHAHEIRGSISSGSKRTVFIVNTVPLVHQQALAIQTHTALNVGKYEGSMGVDFWTDEKWEEELDKNEVLVLVAQIFHDLVIHARLKLSSINLLIMDECHHATGCHPMREIMRQYESLKKSSLEKCPKVLGLTACVIQRKCKKKDVMDSMKKLEVAMDCALETAKDQDEVVRYSTGPKESIICYGFDEETDYQEVIKAQLLGLLNDVNEFECIQGRYKKVVKKKIENIKHIMTALGDWSVARAVKYEMDHFAEAIDFEDVPAVQEFLQLLQFRFESIHEFCVAEESKMDSPEGHVTKKVERLFEILRACHRREVYGLIFVERRCTAKILYDLLLEVAAGDHGLSFIKPTYIIGSTTRLGTDIRLAELELRKQKETLEKFRKGECNIIVSTSVLEEGLDVRKCNVVIRFDKPVNYRAYVQSKGRARAHPSRYLLMVPETDLLEMKETVDVYKEIGKSLMSLCHNRSQPSLSEMSQHYEQDVHVAPYEPYGSDGPKVTINSAISLINIYCGKLPHDKFTELLPEVVSTINEEDKVMVGIRLPINSCLKEMVHGDWMENKELAKKSAAMCVCKKLHEIGELNERLRPTEFVDDGILEDLIEIPIEEASKDGAHEPGTKKRCQIYEKEVCEAFTHFQEGGYYLYSISMRPNKELLSSVVIDSSECDTTVGFICKQKLKHCPFPLYFSKWGELEVSIKCINELIDPTPEQICKIQHFHRLVFENLLSINSSLFEFSPGDSGVYIVPIGKTGNAQTIHEDILNQIAPLKSLRCSVENRLPNDKAYQFNRPAFEDAIVYPLYDSQSDAMYYISEILDNVNPRAEFPDLKDEFSSYEEYFFRKYGMRISNREQPLVVVKHLPKDLKYLKKIECSGQKTKKKRKHLAMFIPELCGIMPLKASLWWQIMCVPSILCRLNGLNLAMQLNTDLEITKCSSEDSENLAVSNTWTEEITKRMLESHKKNLSVLLVKKKKEYIHPFMLLNALTLRGANDCVDLERLEVLGDSFLKYITAERLFLKDSRKHEGQLSSCRSKLVSNRTLYSLAKKRKIPEKIQSINLCPQTNGFLPGFIIKHQVDLKLRNLNLPHHLWPLLPDFGHLDNLEKEVEMIWNKNTTAGAGSKKGGTCYNPWMEHELSDKSIADSVEALIGAYLLVCGSETAINFLSELGVCFFRDESLRKSLFEIPSPQLNNEEWAKTELLNLYYRACLDRLEEKIHYEFRDKGYIVQAVTHTSFCQNKVTDCYQRLEFLGDAVLDFLVTGHVFFHHATYTPGQISDLRSYYVKNETLAEVAAKKELHKHLLYFAPKLQTSIDKFLNIMVDEQEERDLSTEDDEVNSEDVDVPKVLGDLVEAIIGAVYLDSERSIEKAWEVIEVLMGDLLKKPVSSIPVNCVRELYEMLPEGVQFEKVPRIESDDFAQYKVQIDGLPALYGKGKNYRTAKKAAAKKGIEKINEVIAQKIAQGFGESCPPQD